MSKVQYNFSKELAARTRLLLSSLPESNRIPIHSSIFCHPHMYVCNYITYSNFGLLFLLSLDTMDHVQNFHFIHVKQMKERAWMCIYLLLLLQDWTYLCPHFRPSSYSSNNKGVEEILTKRKNSLAIFKALLFHQFITLSLEKLNRGKEEEEKVERASVNYSHSAYVSTLIHQADCLQMKSGAIHFNLQN